jgi:hypothetical protein
MGIFLEITTTNYNGQLADITFFPCSGGSINLGQVILPYYYDNPNYYGTYQIYILKYDKYCDLVIPCPTPSVTSTPTPTPTPKIRNLAYNVLSCCSRLSGVIILPSTFDIGTTIVTTSKLCMTITGFAPKGSIPTFTWSGISYGEGCEKCLEDYPCNPNPTPTPTTTGCKGCFSYTLDGGLGRSGYTEFSYVPCGERTPVTVFIDRTDTIPGNTLTVCAECYYGIVIVSGPGSYTVDGDCIQPTQTPTPTPTMTQTPANNYCILITNESGCGTYNYPTQGNGLINGKKYWNTILDGKTVLIYWDNIQVCWVVKNTNTNEQCSKLFLNSEYPVGDYTEWVSTIPPTSGCSCLSTDTYFTVRLIDCPTPTPTPTATVTPTVTPTNTLTSTPTSTPTPTQTPTQTITQTPTQTITQTPTVTQTSTTTPTPTQTITQTPTLTPTPTVTSSSLPPIIGYFQDCCDSNIKFKIGSLVQPVTVGESYYVQTIGYTGCTRAIDETQVSAGYTTAIILNNEGNCNSCNVKYSIVCPTPTPTPTITSTVTPTVTPTPTVTSTPTLTPTSTLTLTPTNTSTVTPTTTVTETPTLTPTNTSTPTLTPTITPSPSGEVCINCNISGYTYIISDPIILPSPRPTGTPTPTPTNTPDNTVYTIWVHIE